ncbi:MAG: isoprenylcysteine carboxylmethyltransferase family protein [Candidatus Zixiibacteriota bacterium]|nr:MAG: isoprenylcysteine carboxylmethyltransferase family protein [candidate division Zixibacteria bacterium]
MALEYKIFIFIIASGGLLLLSRRSLRAVRSHGFYRFFAWISFLALVLINLDYWFDEAFGIRQIASWLLLLICVFIVVFGTISLRRAGGQDAKRNDELLMGIERTTKLVAAGPYRYIRHPMYSSFLFGAWGVFLKHYSWLSFIMACLTTFFTILTARMEEVENIQYFGDIYKNYMKRTRMFIPFFF